MSERGVWRCHKCSLNQFDSAACVRCKAARLADISTPDPVTPPEPYSFGRRVRAIREAQCMTRSALAVRMRTGLSHIYNMENPHSPTVRSICRLSVALNVPIEALLDPDEVVAFCAVVCRRMSSRQKAKMLAWVRKRAA